MGFGRVKVGSEGQVRHYSSSNLTCGSRTERRKVNIPGNAPLTAKQTVKIVISILSAIGSITVPTTVCKFHFRAIHPSTRSVMPAYANSAVAHACWSCRTRYPTTGAAMSRENVRIFGIV